MDYVLGPNLLTMHLQSRDLSSASSRKGSKDDERGHLPKNREPQSYNKESLNCSIILNEPGNGIIPSTSRWKASTVDSWNSTEDPTKSCCTRTSDPQNCQIINCVAWIRKFSVICQDSCWEGSCHKTWCVSPGLHNWSPEPGTFPNMEGGCWSCHLAQYSSSFLGEIFPLF